MIRQIFDTLLRLEKNSIKVNNSSVSTDNPIPVTLIAGSGSTTADRELITTTYICKNAFSGASVNDTITSTQILDVAGVPVNIATIWRNQTTASDFAFVPSSTNLTLLGTGSTSTALTNTELRATPVTFRMDQTTQGVTNLVTNNNTQVNGVAISTNNGLTNTGTQRVILANRVESLLGGIAINDLSITAGQRIKSLLFTNNTPSVIYLQIFNKASALVLNDVPLNGLIIRVPANSTLDKNAGDFDEAGILYGANIRIGLSSTFGTYTAITPTNTSLNVIIIA